MMRGSARRRRQAFLALVIILGSLPFLVNAAAAHLRRRYPPTGSMFSIDAHLIHLYCMGSGNPAIVLESGLGTDWVSWRLVAPRLAVSHRVCVYDRAGYGWSEPGPRPRTAQRLAAELHGLLDSAGMREPFVLAAHSFGAYPARLFASRFRRRLKGLVLLDPAMPEEPKLRPSLSRRIHRLLPPSGLPSLLRLARGPSSIPAELQSAPEAWRNRFMVGSSYQESAAERSEYDAMAESENEVRAAAFPRDLPLTVLTATYIVAPAHPGAFQLDADPRHIELQRNFAALSAHGRQIVAANCGHTVQLDRPALAVSAIGDMAAGGAAEDTVQGGALP